MELKRIFSEIRATVLYSTSNPEEAAALGRTLVHIREGKIIQVGGIRECYRNPADVTAATYYSPVGINVLRANCVEISANKYLEINNLIRLDVTKYRIFKEGEEYLVGIYPYDFKISEEKSENLVKIPIKVEFVENMGSELVITAKCGDYFVNILTPEVERLTELKYLKYAFVSLNDIIIFSDEGKYIQRLGGS